MKLFKTTALIAALATSFSASAALKTLDDAALTEVAGQEGITIKMSLGIENLDIGYHDDLEQAAKDDFTATSTTGGVLGITGISTGKKDLNITQTVDIVTATDAEVTLEGAGKANDRVLKMTVSGIEGTFNIGAIRIGDGIKNTIGDGTANSTKATSIGGVVLGNLKTTNTGITQYIYAH